MLGAEAIELELPAWQLPEGEPALAPDPGDVWHDSAEDAEWLTDAMEEDDEDAAMVLPDAAAAAAAFGDACSLYDALRGGQQLSPQQRAALQQQMGVSSLHHLPVGDI
jgi:hypothetical protein